MKLLAAVAVACLLGGCSSKSAEPATPDGTGPCADSKYPYEASFAAGLVKTSGDKKNKVKLVDALPAPPAYGPNKWTIQILDPNDKPLSGVTGIQVHPFMPNHGHGQNPTFAEVGTMDAQGTCVVDKLNFGMAGVWRITIAVNGQTVEDLTSTGTQFAFCIDG